MQHLLGVIDGLFRGAETFITTGWDLTKVLQAIAAIVTISTGAYAIYKTIKFAERRLAKRLAEFLEREEKRLAADCRKLLGAAEKRSRLRTDIEPILTNRSLNRALNELRFGKKEKARRSLESALQLIDEKVDTAVTLKNTHERHRAAAYLLLGSIADTEGNHVGALAHFETVLRLNPGDSDALRYAGLQLLQIPNPRQALTYFVRLEECAGGDDLLAAQSLVLQARAHTALATLPSLNRANALLRRVVYNFPVSMLELERAEIHQLHGTVRRKLTRRTAALQSYQEAQKIYEGLTKKRGRTARAAILGLASLKIAITEITDVDKPAICNGSSSQLKIENQGTGAAQ